MSLRSLNVIGALVAAAIAASLLAAPTAVAGTFEIVTCSADSVANPPLRLMGADDAWRFATNDATHFEVVDHCPPSDDSGIDGRGAETTLRSGAVSQGRSAEVTFNAPTGTLVTRLRLWRSVGKQLNEWELYTRTAEGTKL